MSWLSEALHAAARALTIPHDKRVEINKHLQDNPALLGQVNRLKEALTVSLVHAAAGEHSDPLQAAISGMLIAQQVERMIPTPPTPEPVPGQPDPAPAAPAAVAVPDAASLRLIGFNGAPVMSSVDPPTVHMDPTTAVGVIQ